MNINTAITVAPKFEDRATAPVDAPAPSQAAAGKQADAAAGAGASAAPSRQQVVDAVKQINQSLPASAHGLEFSIDDDSKQTVVKIIDVSTREVVRQIPTVEALEIAKSLDKMMGRLISDRV